MPVRGAWVTFQRTVAVSCYDVYHVAPRLFQAWLPWLTLCLMADSLPRPGSVSLQKSSICPSRRSCCACSWAARLYVRMQPQDHASTCRFGARQQAAHLPWPLTGLMTTMTLGGSPLPSQLLSCRTACTSSLQLPSHCTLADLLQILHKGAQITAAPSEDGRHGSC